MLGLLLVLGNLVDTHLSAAVAALWRTHSGRGTALGTLCPETSPVPSSLAGFEDCNPTAAIRRSRRLFPLFFSTLPVFLLRPTFCSFVGSAAYRPTGPSSSASVSAFFIRLRHFGQTVWPSPWWLAGCAACSSL